MTVADFDQLDEADKKHFYRCGQCGEMVDMRQLDDVLFHEDHVQRPDMQYGASIRLGEPVQATTRGKAHGENRAYQIHCRDLLQNKYPGFWPYSGDGIDVGFTAGGTTWTIDVALRNSEGALLVAECRRRKAPTKQDDIAAFAYKVELLRKHFSTDVAGAFLCKSSPQLGAVKTSQDAGIIVAQLLEGNISEGFSVAFHRYEAEREKRLRDFVFKVSPGDYTVTGGNATCIRNTGAPSPD
jgi:hypothetical protein